MTWNGRQIRIQKASSDRSFLNRCKIIFIYFENVAGPSQNKVIASEEIKLLFWFAGEIKGLRKPQVRNKQSIAFVEYFTHAAARKALTMDERIYKGWKIHVDLSHSNQSNVGITKVD